VVVCLEQGKDLHMAQLMPLPLTVSCLSKIQIGLPFSYRLTWVAPEKGLLNACVCVSPRKDVHSKIKTHKERDHFNYSCRNIAIAKIFFCTFQLMNFF